MNIFRGRKHSICGFLQPNDGKVISAPSKIIMKALIIVLGYEYMSYS